jgi:hypothetical protein
MTPGWEASDCASQLFHRTGRMAKPKAASDCEQQKATALSNVRRHKRTLSMLLRL